MAIVFYVKAINYFTMVKSAAGVGAMLAFTMMMTTIIKLGLQRFQQFKIPFLMNY